MMQRSNPHRTVHVSRTLLRAGLCAAMLACTLIAAGRAFASPGNEAAAGLRARLDTLLNSHGEPKVVVGARVVELPSGQVLYDRNGSSPMIPASNMKLLIMAAAIDRLGADYHLKTVLAVRGKDLVVIGSGDPVFGDERLAQQRKETITAVFHDWAAKLQASGIRQIPGDIIIDDSVFDQQFVHPNWPDDQFQRWYEAPIGGLNFNANCTAVEVSPTSPGQPARVRFVPGNTLLKMENKTTTGQKDTAAVNRSLSDDRIVVSGTVAKRGVLGPVTVRDPGMYFGYVLKTVLASKGIALHGNVVRQRVRLADGSLPKDCHPVAVHRTPLSDVLRRAGKDSLGMCAEALLKLLGTDDGSRTGSWTAGRSAVEAFLKKVGVPPGQVIVDDGSGLSRNNRLSAAAMTDVLRHIQAAPGGRFDMLRASLALAGEDGTLKKRMRDPHTKGRVFAKTGYINGVRTLAGYVHTRSDRWLAFAIYYNQAAKTRPLTRIQDDACRLLVNWPDLPNAK